MARWVDNSGNTRLAGSIVGGGPTAAGGWLGPFVVDHADYVPDIGGGTLLGGVPFSPLPDIPADTLLSRASICFDVAFDGTDFNQTLQLALFVPPAVDYVGTDMIANVSAATAPVAYTLPLNLLDEGLLTPPELAVVTAGTVTGAFLTGWAPTEGDNPPSQGHGRIWLDVAIPPA